MCRPLLRSSELSFVAPLAVASVLVVAHLFAGSSWAQPAEAGPTGDPAARVVPAEAGVPVVVAVDTSRSLNQRALGDVVDRLRRVLDALPTDTPTALLSFDDEPRWLVAPWADPAAVAAGLDAAKLDGDFTLLHDALFTATRALEGGGIVLLASDGRDENSAVTVDDLARRAEAEGIRILTVGTGRSIDTLSLRRLAMVTDGTFLGDVHATDASEIAEAVDGARSAVAERRREARGVRAASSVAAPSSAALPATSGRAAGQPDVGESATIGTAASESAGDAATTVAPARSRLPGLDWSWVAAGAVLALLLLGLAFLRRSRPAPSADLETADDEELERRAEDEAVAASLRQDLLDSAEETAGESAETSVDTQKIQQLSLEDRLEKTRVLSSHAMLIVRRPGESPRSFLLDEHKAFAVGRDREINTLALPDPSLSARHFKVVPRGPEHFFVDVGSTNGSFIGGRRTTAKRLRSGDRIRAGQVEFEFQSYGASA
ncbi:MAG: FHA domain-containing protein [Acidobacteriota bacterium]